MWKELLIRNKRIVINKREYSNISVTEENELTIVDSNNSEYNILYSKYNAADVTKTLDIESLKSLNNLINSIRLDSSKVDILGIEIYNEINKVLKILESINSKGYINDTDINNYPLINECIEMFINRKGKEKIDATKSIKIGKYYLPSDSVTDLYKWIYNLILLKLHTNIQEVIVLMNSKGMLEDMILDYKNLGKLILGKIDPSIRQKLSKRGISFISNIYTGFDTEYVNKDNVTNRMLSSQLAVNSALILKLPLLKQFNYEEIDVLTNKVLNSGGLSSDKTIKYDLIKNIINRFVVNSRLMNNSNYDYSINLLIEGLKSKKIKHIEDEESIYFFFDRSIIRNWIKKTDTMSFKELVLTSNSLMENDIKKQLNEVKSLLEYIYKNGVDETIGDLSIKGSSSELLNSNYLEDLPLENNNEIDVSLDRDLNVGKFKRTYNQSFSNEKISVTHVKNNYFIGHLTNADLSILSDFDTIKNDLDIVSNSFVTLTKPLSIDGVNVYIRDTMLLAPGSMKSLNNIGSLYKNLEKIGISNYYKENMNELLKDNPELFDRYALRDALITLVHASYMEDFYNSLGGIGVPLTLSTLSARYIRKFWKKIGYKGYQVSQKYLLSNVTSSLTPKGLGVLNDIGSKLPLYLEGYRGGRNESYMYGFEISDRIWYDYDLVSAYTTAMTFLGSPDYKNARIISASTLKSFGWEKLIYSYTMLRVKFKFPSDVKYPSIPTKIDENVTVYPLEGESLITSLEYLTAMNQKCDIEIKEVFYIPFDKHLKPFDDCIKELQSKRSDFEKNTIGNLLYKEIGNSLYGLTAKGINDKKKYDTRTKEMKRMIGNDLSNPLIATWITSFIRSTISELLHYTHKLNGAVVSVTTDGFITDVDNLEDKILALQKVERKGRSFLKEYKVLRKNIGKSKNDEALEVKKSGRNILSWCTRGQLSEESNIMAATGFQKGSANLKDIQDLFLNLLNSEDKSLTYLKTGLRSALDIYKSGGHVTKKYADQVYRLLFDNKRVIIDNPNSNLLDSKPLKNIEEGRILRYISNLPKTKQYTKTSNLSTSGLYKSKDELIYRNFIKALHNNDLNLDINYFDSYKDIVLFIKKFDNNINISTNYISQLKRRGSYVKIPWNLKGEEFVCYVKRTFPQFNSSELFIKGSIVNKTAVMTVAENKGLS